MEADGSLVALAFDRHAGELGAFLRRVVRDHEIAADLTAESFAKLVAENDAGRFPDQPRAWLYRVASNLASDHGRRRQVESRAVSSLGHTSRGDAFPSPEHEILQLEQRAELNELLGTVGADARQALVMAAHGYRGTQIARSLGRTHLATRALLCRSRVPLRRALEARE